VGQHSSRRVRRTELPRGAEPRRSLTGFVLEITVTKNVQLREMLAWDYAQADFLELRYEDLVADELGGFEKVFRHYGLTDCAIERGLDIVDAASFGRLTGRAVGEIGEHSHAGVRISGR
jgi:hypothetical protein